MNRWKESINNMISILEEIANNRPEEKKSIIEESYIKLLKSIEELKELRDSNKLKYIIYT